MASRIAPDLGDPVRTAWQVAWVGHAMLHDPLHLFDSNAFYPHPLSLAFSDSLLGYGPAAFFGSGTVAALVRYNLLFLLIWSLCFVGAYLLARELGLRWIGAAVAAVAFAYAHYRVTEAGHFQVISSGGLALAMFLLLRGYRRGSPGSCSPAGSSPPGRSASASRSACSTPICCSCSPCSCSCTGGSASDPGPGLGGPRRRGEPSAALQPSANGAATSSPARPSTRGPLIPRRLLAVTLIGIAVLGAVAVYQARPYLKVANEYPTAKRTIKEVETYSAGPAAWFAASSENRVWGSVTAGVRAKVHSKNESVFFPGGLVLVLALIGLCGGSVYTRRLRLGARPRDPHVLDPRARLRLDRRRLSVPPAVRLRPGLGRRARAGPDLHARDAVLRAARGRGRAVLARVCRRLGRTALSCARCPGSSAWCS